MACNCTLPGWQCENDYLTNETGECLTYTTARFVVLWFSLISSFLAAICDTYRAAWLFKLGVHSKVVLRSFLIAVVAFGMHTAWLIAEVLRIAAGRFEHSDVATALLSATATGLTPVLVGEVLLRFMIVITRHSPIKIHKAQFTRIILRLGQLCALLFIATLYAVDFVDNATIQIVFIRTFAASVILCATFFCITCGWNTTTLIQMLSAHGVEATKHSFQSNFAKVIRNLQYLRLGVIAALLACLAISIIAIVVPSWFEYLRPLMFVSNLGFFALYYKVDSGFDKRRNVSTL